MLDPWLAALSALLLVIGLGGALASPPRTISRGKLPDHVPSRSDGDVVDGAVPGDGRRGLRRGGLADQNGRSGDRRPGAGGGGLHPGGAGQRRGMGQADVGTWWIWDARLTSELVLLFLYAGVIALWHAFDDRRLAGRAAGILVLVGVVNLPIIHYSVYWWNTLHQGSTNLQQTIDPSMRLPLRICIFAFLTLSVTLTLMRLRNLILQLERRRPWVVALVNKGAAR